MTFKVDGLDYTKYIINRSLRRGRMIITLSENYITRGLFLTHFGPEKILYQDEDMFLTGEHDFDVFTSRELYWENGEEENEDSTPSITVIIYWGMR